MAPLPTPNVAQHLHKGPREHGLLHNASCVWAGTFRVCSCVYESKPNADGKETLQHYNFPMFTEHRTQMFTEHRCSQNTSRTSLRGPRLECDWRDRMQEALSGLPAADPATPAADPPIAQQHRGMVVMCEHTARLGHDTFW